MKHDELQENLAEHLRAGTDRMVWTNTQLGPSGSPRPDVFTVNKSFSKFASDAYEIKVSVSDLRSDVTSGKWQSYRKFAHRVWFAFPRGMAPLDLIPKECGVILRSDAGWRAARKPVAQVLDTLPRDAWLKLLMDLHPINSMGFAKAPRHVAADYRGAELIRAKLGNELADLFADAARAASILEGQKKRLDAELAAIDARKAERQKYAAEEAQRTAKSLETSMVLLGEELGVKAEDCTASALRDAVVMFRRLMSAKRIDDTIKLLEGLREVMPANEPERRGCA